MHLPWKLQSKILNASVVHKLFYLAPSYFLPFSKLKQALLYFVKIIMYSVANIMVKKSTDK